MDNDGGLSIRNWGFYEQPLKGNLGLQLMSSVVDRDTKSFFARDPPMMNGGNGGFLHRNCGVPPSSLPMELVREGWMNHREKFLHVLPGNSHFTQISDPSSGSHSLQVHQTPLPLDLAKSEKVVQVEDFDGRKGPPSEKRSEAHTPKPPKAKKAKKSPTKLKEAKNTSMSRPKPAKNTGVFINGIDVDILGIPIPVCSCTGTPQQCYRWGCGGWQSACCTTNLSMYPLPMSPKRRGARIAGRKMSQGAFKKVVEKLATEGYSLSTPIDLKTHWAKHGTNKFVTIRFMQLTLLDIPVDLDIKIHPVTPKEKKAQFSFILGTS